MADILREYLVSLGWRIDEASWKKYTQFVSLAAKTTAELGSTAVEAATAIELAVAKVARQYESLYYVSRRTGQSAAYIQSAQFAFRQMGLSADDATDAIEGVAHAMRTSPGLAALFGGAGKPEDIVDRLRGLPYFIAQQFGQMAGIGERTFQHIWMFGPQERAAAEDHNRRLQEAGINADDAAKRFTDFGRVLNTLEDNFGVLETRIAMDWVDPTEKGVRALDAAVQWFSRVDKATQGWVGTLASLAVTLTGLFGAEKLLSKLLGFGGATISGTAAGAASKLLGGKNLLKGGLYGALAWMLGTVKENDPETKRALQDALGPLFYELGLSTSPNLSGGPASSPAPSGPAGRPSKGDPRGMLAAVRAAAIRNGINPDIMEIVARSEGLAEPYAGGDYGTSFGAMQLHRGGPGSVGYEYERQTGHSLSDPRNEQDEIEFAARWARLHGWDAWMGARAHGITGMAGITVNQKTDIHVTGGDAGDTATRVLKSQDRVNDGLVRNLAGATR